MLVINLKQLHNVRGIYPLQPNGAPSPVGSLPERLARLHPDAAFPDVSCSDMYRDAAGSLRAVQTKAGTKPPGYSGHNFGLSIDVDVTNELKQRRWSKPQFDAFMAAHGWYCHRRDGLRGGEDWHYNFLSADALRQCGDDRTTARGLEYAINKLYSFVMDQYAIQTALKKLGFYTGDVDGSIGPKSRAAIAMFRSEWRLNGGHMIDDRFVRTLAVVSATVVVVK